MWGYVYNRTVHYLAELGDIFSLMHLAEPRIEPEIVFRLAVAPVAGMDERTLLESVDWVAHGFEVVQSIFPGWQFSVPDTDRSSSELWSSYVMPNIEQRSWAK